MTSSVRRRARRSAIPEDLREVLRASHATYAMVLARGAGLRLLGAMGQRSRRLTHERGRLLAVCLGGRTGLVSGDVGEDPAGATGTG